MFKTQKGKIIIVSVLIIVIIVCVFFFAIRPNSIYKKGIAAMQNGNYDEAVELLEKVSNVKDASKRIQQAKADKLFAEGDLAGANLLYDGLDSEYQTHIEEYKALYAAAEDSLQNGDIQTAMEEFTQLGTYEDAADKVEECNKTIIYLAAGEKYAAKDIEGAYEDYISISGWADSSEIAAGIEEDYAAAVAALESGEPDAAVEGFTALGNYSDSIERLNDSYWKKAEKELASMDYDAAIASYQAISDEQKVNEGLYSLAFSAQTAGNIAIAIETYGMLGDYEDSAEKYTELSYEQACGFYSTGDYSAALDGFTNLNYRNSETMACACAILMDADQPGEIFELGVYADKPIEWILLSADENGIVALSEKILDSAAYNVETIEVSWNDCTLNAWLNNDFLSAAFDAGLNIEVSIPQKDQITDYMQAERSEEALANGVHGKEQYGWYWLRTDETVLTANCVSPDGYITTGTVSQTAAGIRPIFQLHTDF